MAPRRCHFRLLFFGIFGRDTRIQTADLKYPKPAMLEGAQVLAVHRQDFECVERHFLVGLAGVQAVEIGKCHQNYDRLGHKLVRCATAAPEFGPEDRL